MVAPVELCESLVLLCCVWECVVGRVLALALCVQDLSSKNVNVAHRETENKESLETSRQRKRKERHF